MLHNRVIIILMISSIFLVLFPSPIERASAGIDVNDDSLLDWANAPVQLYDPPEKPVPPDMTNLSFVAFDFDDTWLYVRWDLFDNCSYKAGVLYDMGINLTATEPPVWDIYASAQIDLVGGLPVIANISIRDADDNHIWNASDDGNMTEDGSLYLGPTPGLPPGNLSVEARFPLAYIGIPSGVIFGQFRSHSSPSVKSAVKDKVPETGYIILTIDNLPPQLKDLTDYPDPQENGDFVNITVNVTDDIAVNTVWVNITLPNGSWENESMSWSGGDIWYYNSTYDALGVYYYTVWANDSADNWNYTGPGDFTIRDNNGPELSDLADAPDPQENGFHVNITVNVSDDIAVDGVWLNITYPDSAWKNISMQFGGGDEWFYNRTYPDLGTYSYTVWANDTNDNWNSTGPANFMIRDTDPPELTNFVDVPDPQGIGGNVIISVDVLDDVAVDEVWVNIIYPSGSHVNVSMQHGVGDEWLYDTSYDDLNLYSYTIWASDTSNNWNSTGLGTFTIQDLDAPEFIGVNDFPDPQENGGYVNITANIIDDAGVDEVWVNVTYPNGNQFNITMERGIGDDWYYNTTYDILDIYSYVIWVNDTNNNWNHTAQGTFTIRDTNSPDIIDLNDTPDPQENGGHVNITVNVMDDVAVDEVWIDITYPDGSTVNTSMVHGVDDTWYFETSYSDLGEHSYRIWANDTSNNFNYSNLGVFTIRDTDKPEIGDPNATPGTQDVGGNVNITVDVTDDVGVEEVWITIIFPNGSSYNFSMDKGPGNKWFFNGSYNMDGDYTYIISAVDPSGNWNSTDPETFTIEPEPPEEPPKLLYITLLFIYWPLLLIIFVVVLLWREGFDNRYKRDIDKIMEALPYIYAEQPENLPPSMKTIHSLITLSLKTGVPVEEFILAALSAKSTAKIDLGLPGKAGDDLIAIESLFKK